MNSPHKAAAVDRADRSDDPDADVDMTAANDPGAAARAAHALMARLRDPGNGCPWDRVQTFATIAPYTIEEAYEVADAISRGDVSALQDELGDLLFQVLFHARMAEEAGMFDFAAVCGGLVEKMTRRHPHVFGAVEASHAAAVVPVWEQIKSAERAAKAKAEGRRPSLLDGVPAALPGLTRAVKLQKRAAKVGFDWPSVAPVIAKVREELAELEAELTVLPAEAISHGPPHERVEAEIGDILFAVANLARHLGVDPEAALRLTNQRFTGRFQHIEEALGDGLASASAEAMEAAWEEAKRREATAS